MGIVTNILDALRRVGSPTQKSALRRLEAAVEGKEVIARERVQIRHSSGQAESFVATTLPVPETVVVLTEDEVRPMKENVQYGQEFLSAFGRRRGDAWDPDDLDHCFAAWQASGDKSTYTDNYVVEVLGAMFGEYCIERLDMRWIKLTDQDGTTLAIEGKDKEFRAFPYQSIAKRIRDSEHGFFRPIFDDLSQQVVEARPRGP